MKRIVFFSIILFGCAAACKKDGTVDEDQVKAQLLDSKITQVIPKQFVDSLVKYGFEVHQGVQPPDITGSYLVSPPVLERSNLNDQPGRQFSDNAIRFFNQNAEDFSIELESLQNDKRRTSVRTVISGAGDRFTVYGILLSEQGDKKSEFAYLYSGTIEEGGIRNLKYGLVNIDNDGDGVFFKVGGCRVIYDGDGISERQ